jgi:hypothetical protein
MNIINVPCLALVNPFPVPIDDGTGSQIADIILEL